MAPPTPSHLPLVADHHVPSPTANEVRESEGESEGSVNDEDDKDSDESREADTHSQQEEGNEDDICPDGHHTVDTQTDEHHTVDTEILISQCYHLPLISSSLW